MVVYAYNLSDAADRVGGSRTEASLRKKCKNKYKVKP
jgi:hypothetical protein